MKNTFIAWVIISLIILVLVGFRLLDTSISLKYEVQEPRAMGMKGEDIDDKERLLSQLIFMLKFAAVYIVTNILIVSRWLVKNSLVSKS